MESGIKRIGSFVMDRMEFTVWKEGQSYWVSCPYCGLVELSAWAEPVQRKAKEVINSQ